MVGLYYKVKNFVSLALKICYRIRMLALKMIGFVFEFGLECVLFFSMPVFGGILLVAMVGQVCGWLIIFVDQWLPDEVVV